VKRVIHIGVPQCTLRKIFLENCMNKMNGKQCNVIALLQFMLLHGNKALQPVIQPCTTTNLKRILSMSCG